MGVVVALPSGVGTVFMGEKLVGEGFLVERGEPPKHKNDYTHFLGVSFFFSSPFTRDDEKGKEMNLRKYFFEYSQ